MPYDVLEMCHTTVTLVFIASIKIECLSVFNFVTENGTVPVSFLSFNSSDLFQKNDSNRPIVGSRIISATIDCEVDIEGLPKKQEVEIIFTRLNVSNMRT